MLKDISGTVAEIIVLHQEKNLDYTGDNNLLKRDCLHFTITPMANAIEKLFACYQNNKALIDFEQLKGSF